MDKLFILLRVSVTFPLQSTFCSPMRRAEFIANEFIKSTSKMASSGLNQVPQPVGAVHSSPEEWSYQLKAG